MFTYFYTHKITIVAIGLLIVLCLGSCEYIPKIGQKREEQTGKILAKVNRAYLYQADLPSTLTSPIKGNQDSVQLVKEYIDSWIYHQLMMQKAKDFLPAESIRSIKIKVDDYAGSLYAFEYEKELITQKIDTEVTESELENYYEQNKNSFTSPVKLVKGRYFFMDAETPNEDSIKIWFKKLDSHSYDRLEKAGFQYASNFNLKGQWLSFDQFQAKLPERIKNPEKFLKQKKYVELGDSSRTCLVYIEDYRLEGEIAPLEYKEQDIRKIVINKRRELYLKRIQNSIYNEAKNNKNVEIF